MYTYCSLLGSVGPSSAFKWYQSHKNLVGSLRHVSLQIVKSCLIIQGAVQRLDLPPPLPYLIFLLCRANIPCKANIFPLGPGSPFLSLNKLFSFFITSSEINK